MTTLILIRHGESEANRQGIFAGQIDPDLQNRGKEQAKATAEYIAKNYKIDKIYSSDLTRAYKTAKSLADIQNLEVIKDENFREIYAGKWEGMKFTDLITAYAKDYDMWLNHIGKAVCTDGESVKELGERVMAAATRIAKENDGKTIAIATHATPIRTIQSIIQTGSLDEMENIPWVTNASVTVLEYDNDEWKIVKLSEDEHLGDLRTGLPKNV